MTRGDSSEGTLRVLIVDDEPAALRLLRTLLADHDDVELVGECGSGRAAIERLRSGGVDVLFLDVRMPEVDGFEVLEHLGADSGDALPPAVVFVTAHDDFAVRAFEKDAWDYILKPFDEERLAAALDRVRSRLGGARTDGAPPSERPLERLAVPSGRGRVPIRLEDVTWIGAESNYVRFHLGGSSYLARVSLRWLESRLDPRRFARIHRSAIVQVDRIARLEPCGHGDQLLTLDDGRQLTVSRRYRDRLDAVLEPLS